MKKNMRKFKVTLISIIIISMHAPSVSIAADTQNLKAPSQDMPAASIYSWNPPYSFASEEAIGDLLKALNINRIYQSFGGNYKGLLSAQSTVDIINDLNRRGIDMYLLCGEETWGMVPEDMHYATERIDAIKEYNEGIGSEAPIAGIVFDIESFTSSEWKKLENQEAGLAFSTYVSNMTEIYNYAHTNNVQVINCIPRWLENRGKDESDGMRLLGKFIANCCDELSVMNYNVGGEVADIRNEFNLCKQYGKRIESIFNTMPPNDTTIPESSTYYNLTFDDLLPNWNKLEAEYGQGSIGMSYHHFSTVVPVLTGGGKIARIRAYTSEEDPTRDSYGTTSALSTLKLNGSDGSTITAGLIPAKFSSTTKYGTVFIAVGLKPGVKYTVKSGDPKNYMVLTQTPTFTTDVDNDVDDDNKAIIKDDNGATLYTKIYIKPGIEKADNTLVAKAKSKILNVKYKKLKKKNQIIKKTKAFKISGAKGKVTFKKSSGHKKITVSSVSGK